MDPSKNGRDQIVAEEDLPGVLPVQGTDESLAEHECSDAGPSRRLPRPNPCEWHGHDPPACHCCMGGWLAQGPRPVRLHSCVRRRHWAPTNEFMTWRWSIDLLSLLALPAAPRRSTSWRELMDVSCWLCHSIPCQRSTVQGDRRAPVASRSWRPSASSSGMNGST